MPQRLYVPRKPKMFTNWPYRKSLLPPDKKWMLLAPKANDVHVH